MSPKSSIVKSPQNNNRRGSTLTLHEYNNTRLSFSQEGIFDTWTSMMAVTH
mgnify:FL=1